MKNNIEIGETVAKIELLNKKGEVYHTMIDVEFVDLVSTAVKWYVSNTTRKKRTNYVIGLMPNGKSKPLHRLILGCESGEVVDHINGNGLDNRKRNLRAVTCSENSLNTKLKSNNASGMRGVTRNGNGWGVQIVFDGRRHWLGTYSDVEEAKEAIIKFREDNGILLRG